MTSEKELSQIERIRRMVLTLVCSSFDMVESEIERKTITIEGKKYVPASDLKLAIRGLRKTVTDKLPKA